jgi:hypothetical protein
MPNQDIPIKEQLLDSFGGLFNQLGYDHFYTCSCGVLEKCICVSGEEQLKSFLSSSIDRILTEVEKRVRRIDVAEYHTDEFKKGFFIAHQAIINIIAELKK